MPPTVFRIPERYERGTPVGLCLGAYGGTRVVMVSYKRGTPVCPTVGRMSLLAT
jgi:hypothetical protein